MENILNSEQMEQMEQPPKGEKIATYSQTRRLLEKYSHTPVKSFGQNFLVDSHVLDKIIRGANITAADHVLEIGAGLGGLTQALLERTSHVTAVELDKRLAAALHEILPAAQIVNMDIMDYEIPSGINKIVANLPYYLTTPIIMQLLESYRFQSITVMVQKEVAQRMVSRCNAKKNAKGDKTHGALSLAIEYYANAEIIAYVPTNSFLPRPTVGSAVVHMDILQAPKVTADKAALFANIKAGFSKRRKTLVNALYSAELYNLTKDELAALLVSCNFSESIRAEELTLQDWAVLTGRLGT